MNTFQITASRSVSKELQEEFAVLSGDRNPMHMDPVAARRTQAGLPVVHGIHTLLWALESIVASGRMVSPLTGIKAKFLKWVYIGDDAELSLPTAAMIDPARLQVQVLGMQVLTADLTYGNPVPTKPASPLAESPAAPLPKPLDLTFAELDQRAGDAFTAPAAAAEAFFPHLCRAIGAVAVSELAACSYIVGMEAPGLHSMFSKLDLVIGREASEAPAHAALHYTVIYHDERFRKARIAVAGRSVSGTLEVFIRTPPVEQASIADVSSQVASSEFADMKALIVGGSRGLGELTAKLIAAGGGTPTITYAVGMVEAKRVTEQINGWGAQADMLPYDVRKSPQPQLALLNGPITHLFYFATNAIFRPKGELVSAPILAEFSTFYLQGFHDLCLALTQREVQLSSTAKLVVYYPSSIAVEERPAGMTEYAMVKAAGEQMCRDMNQYVPNLHIISTRLPRLRTDQTAGVIPEREQDPIGVLLPIIREMRDLSAGS